MNNQLPYNVTIHWTGNTGSGTSSYTSYLRSHTIHVQGKPTIAATSDPAFRGDITKHNPEDLLLASISSCHMLWYLHLCAQAGIIVVSYTDEAQGTLKLNSNGSGHFTNVTLYPTITITNPQHIELATSLHTQANKNCFIANSLNFNVLHTPIISAQNI